MPVFRTIRNSDGSVGFEQVGLAPIGPSFFSKDHIPLVTPRSKWIAEHPWFAKYRGPRNRLRCRRPSRWRYHRGNRRGWPALTRLAENV